MIQSRKFVAAAIILGIALIVAGLLAAPFNASARAASQAGSDIAADRIGAAFSAIPEKMRADPAIAAAAARLSKGNLAPADCATAVWPNIDASCLSTADGSAAPRVRTITVGYQTGENTTVLVRIPSAEMAQR
jgi:hypothetical protein